MSSQETKEYERLMSEAFVFIVDMIDDEPHICRLMHGKHIDQYGLGGLKGYELRYGDGAIDSPKPWLPPVFRADECPVGLVGGHGFSLMCYLQKLEADSAKPVADVTIKFDSDVVFDGEPEAIDMSVEYEVLFTKEFRESRFVFSFITWCNKKEEKAKENDKRLARAVVEKHRMKKQSACMSRLSDIAGRVVEKKQRTSAPSSTK